MRETVEISPVISLSSAVCKGSKTQMSLQYFKQTNNSKFSFLKTFGVLKFAILLIDRCFMFKNGKLWMALFWSWFAKMHIAPQNPDNETRCCMSVDFMPLSFTGTASFRSVR